MRISRQDLWFLFIPLLGLVLLIFLAWPVLVWLWHEWQHNSYYNHGILVVLVSAFLAWRRWTTAPEHQSDGDNVGLFLIAGGIIALLYLVNDRAFYLAAFAIIAILAGFVWTFWGVKHLQRLAFPFLFLGLAVPLPQIERATLPLALLTGVCSTTIVRWMGLKVAVVGNAVTLPDTTLVIGAQCSGISSIMALFALTLLFAYTVRGPVWGKLTIVALTIPLAMLGNILRVASLLFIARHLGTDAAFDFYHTYSGPVFFTGVLFLLIPLSSLLQCKTLRSEIL